MLNILFYLNNLTQPAIAALASKKQGLYNQFHSSLMSLRGRISENQIFNTAKNIGLDIEQLKIEMNNPEIKINFYKIVK